MNAATIPLDEPRTDVERRLEESRALLSTARALGTTLAPEEIARRAAREIVRLLGADTALYFDVAEDRSHVTAIAGYHVPEWLKGLYPRVEAADISPVLMEAVSDHRAVWSADVARDPRFAHPWLASFPVVPRSLLHHAIENRGRVIGGLFVCWWHTPHEPTPAELELVAALSQQAGLAIEGARLHRRAEERADKLRTLAELTRLITSASGPGVFDAIAHAAGRLLDATLVHVWVDDADAQVLRARGAWHTPGDRRPRPLEMPRGKGIAGDILATGRSEFVADVRRDPRFLPMPASVGTRGYGGAPMRVGDRVVGVLVVLMDRVHEMTPDEREVLHLFADHAAIAIDRARLFGDLQRAYDTLQQTQAQLIQAEKLRALGEMAGGVAHDFNNLLAAILGRAQFVLGKLPALDPGDIRRCVKIIETAAIDGARTVRRLQEFTRATPRRPHAVEVVGVGDLLEDALHVARRQWASEIEAADGALRFELDTVPVPPVAGHATELRDALLNLVANGVEAMPRGGVLTLRARSANAEVTIDIVDGGIGIPPEMQARVFEPFFTTKGPQRSGLGLSVAFGIVSRHGGRIEIRSLPGEGTTVRVTLLADPLTARRPEPPVAPPAPSTLRILLIEHDEQIRRTLGDVLRDAGHDVVEAEDGPVGLGLADTIQFDLVCADASLPGMGGAEVLERIVQQRPALTCLLISAAATPAVTEPGVASSTQPFHVNDVLKVLATVCAAPDSGGQRQ